MSGFFEEAGIIESQPQIKNEKVKADRIYSCSDCKLYQGCRSPKMEPTGEGKKKILMLAEAPGKQEDLKNKQLIGDAGQILREVLDELGYDLDTDFWKTNAVICRPPENKTPSNLQITACRSNLFKTIEQYKPSGIIVLGATAFESLIGYSIGKRIGKMSISEWIGECIPDQNLKLWICPVFHPSYILRNEKDKALRLIWKKDLKNAIETCQKSFYVHNYSSDVLTIFDKDKAIKVIIEARDWEALAFDYETTGRKPHRKEQKIVSASISNGIVAYAFPFFEDEEFRRQWKKLMQAKRLKIAHSAKFERLWTQTKLGYDIGGDVWCTSIAQKCIDNRKNVKLKFWVYANFGVIDYSSKVDKFITSVQKGEDKKSNNSLNQIEEADLKELLYYNGLDSLYDFKLYEIQRDKLTGIKQSKGFKFFTEGSEAMVYAQQNGVCVNLRRLKNRKEKITLHLEEIEKKINESEEVKLWDINKKFNFGSSDQLSHLLFDILKVKSDKKTVGGKPSTDASVLEKIDLPIVKDILEYKRWETARDTYIGQFEREYIEGKIHPFFNLDQVVTFRSSSSAINFQNIPKHDKEIKEILRSLIHPSLGHRLIEWDFKQLEVVISCCYNKDPNLIAYVTNPKSDMHRDEAMKIFFRKKEFFTNPKNKEEKDLAKDERYIAKNKHVFREFYGGYFEQTAPEIWSCIQNATKEHLYEKGIRHLQDFTDHLEQIEKDFWGIKFPVYAEWKKETYSEYQKKGYIDLYTGFRCYGPMKRNEVINYRIQGSAFHVLLWLFIQVVKEIKRKPEIYKYSKLPGQIHDAIVGDIHPDEENYLDEFILEYGTKKVREYWDWLIIPLKIEKEWSDIDGTWAEMNSSKILGE